MTPVLLREFWGKGGRNVLQLDTNMGTILAHTEVINLCSHRAANGLEENHCCRFNKDLTVMLLGDVLYLHVVKSLKCLLPCMKPLIKWQDILLQACRNPVSGLRLTQCFHSIY